MDEAAQREAVTGWWKALGRQELFLLGKLFMGEMRVGVSKRLVVRALAQVAGVDRPTISHRLMGQWEPTAAFFEGLISEASAEADVSRPYPYFLASPLEAGPEGLGEPHEWQAEWASRCAFPASPAGAATRRSTRRTPWPMPTSCSPAIAASMPAAPAKRPRDERTPQK